MAFTANTRCSASTTSPVYISSMANRKFPSQARISYKSLKVTASTSVGYSDVSAVDKQSSPFKSSSWQWKFNEHSVKIYYEEHKGEEKQAEKKVLMIPTISDVSTVEEWREVAKDLIGRDGASNWSATIIDWPGLGYSDKPKLEYNADVMEKFLVDIVKSPISTSEKDLVIVGGGHAATILVRAAKKGLLKPSAIAAVAPTWAGPLPIVFGRDSSMETRYGLLRGTLRAPAVGWMMYNVLVSNEKAIESQYKSHVYSDPTKVTPEIIQTRYNLTKTKGARYVPAAFLTGLLDPVASREEFLEAFAAMDETKIPLMCWQYTAKLIDKTQLN